MARNKAYNSQLENPRVDNFSEKSEKSDTSAANYVLVNRRSKHTLSRNEEPIQFTEHSIGTIDNSEMLTPTATPDATFVDDGEALDEQHAAEPEEPTPAPSTTRLLEETVETNLARRDEIYEDFMRLAKIPVNVLLLKLVIYIIMHLF